MCLGMANGGKTPKMTDKEIKKALGCCIGRYSCGDCEYRDTCGDDMNKILKIALDLINRQQAEIEYMQGEREVLLEDIQFSSNQVIEQQKEIERLTINMNAFGLGMKREKERADTIKAEAIKEFADRLKSEMLGKYCLYFDGEITNAVIEKLVKEMVGEQK